MLAPQRVHHVNLIVAVQVRHVETQSLLPVQTLTTDHRAVHTLALVPPGTVAVVIVAKVAALHTPKVVLAPAHHHLVADVVTPAAALVAVVAAVVAVVAVVVVSSRVSTFLVISTSTQ